MSSVLKMGVVVVALGGCATPYDVTTYQGVCDQARMEYFLDCVDHYVDGRNQPLALADRVCRSHSQQRYPR